MVLWILCWCLSYSSKGVKVDSIQSFKIVSELIATSIATFTSTSCVSSYPSSSFQWVYFLCMRTPQVIRHCGWYSFFVRKTEIFFQTIGLRLATLTAQKADLLLMIFSTAQGSRNSKIRLKRSERQKGFIIRFFIKELEFTVSWIRDMWNGKSWFELMPGRNAFFDETDLAYLQFWIGGCKQLINGSPHSA